jgi:ankyrin repeat protein
MANLLLDRGADINAKEPGGMTPLFHAVLAGDCATVELLLERGADINAKITLGVTAISLALRGQGGPDMIRMLQDKGILRRVPRRGCVMS